MQTFLTPRAGAPDEDVPDARMVLLDVFDTVREPLLVLDQEFRVAEANRAFFSTFAVKPQDTIGKVLFTLGDGQWNIPPLQDLLRDKLAVAPRLHDIDVDHAFPGIGRKVMRLNARVLAHGANAPRFILLAIEDITAWVSAERRLAAQQQELERSNRALDEFASVAAHDLQEPLRKILSFGERLSGVAPLLERDARQYLERMLGAAARMRILIHDLLAYSQTSTRVQPFTATDLGVIAAEVASDLETALADADGQLEIGALPTIDADALQMRQLLQNLVSNALKFRRTDARPLVRLTATQLDAQYCTLTVSDNGIGFNEAHAERIFRMFERLHGRAQYDGSGIGLAICRRIVERHGGTIAATSRPGEGAAFAVTLPIAHRVTEYTP